MPSLQRNGKKQFVKLVFTDSQWRPGNVPDTPHVLLSNPQDIPGQPHFDSLQCFLVGAK